MIIGFEPQVSMDTVHHLMVVGCSTNVLGSTRHNLWNCGGTLGENSLDFGGTCQGGEMQVGFNTDWDISLHIFQNFL